MTWTTFHIKLLRSILLQELLNNIRNGTSDKSVFPIDLEQRHAVGTRRNTPNVIRNTLIQVAQKIIIWFEFWEEKWNLLSPKFRNLK